MIDFILIAAVAHEDGISFEKEAPGISLEHQPKGDPLRKVAKNLMGKMIFKSLCSDIGICKVQFRRSNSNCSHSRVS